MNQHASVLRTGRKFDQVLAGAREVFLADGFEGASVDKIAKAAGVSKATLYSYFPDKRVLFMEVVRSACVQQADASLDLAPGSCGPRDVLRAAAERVHGVLLGGFSLQLFRIFVAEADRFPELGPMFYESGPMVLHGEIRDSGAHQRMAADRRAGVYNPWLVRITEIMTENIETPLEIGALAAQAGLGKRQVERLFTRYMNEPPYRYYLRLRLERARHLVRYSDLLLHEVAIACGFGSAASFSRAYRAHFGQTPRSERSGRRATGG